MAGCYIHTATTAKRLFGDVICRIKTPALYPQSWQEITILLHLYTMSNCKNIKCIRGNYYYRNLIIIRIGYNGSVALLSHNTLKWSAILGLSFFAWCWWPMESMLWGSSALSEFCTSILNRANTLALCQTKAMLPKSYHIVMSID